MNDQESMPLKALEIIGVCAAAGGVLAFFYAHIVKVFWLGGLDGLHGDSGSNFLHAVPTVVNEYEIFAGVLATLAAFVVAAVLWRRSGWDGALTCIAVFGATLWLRVGDWRFLVVLLAGSILTGAVAAGCRWIYLDSSIASSERLRNLQAEWRGVVAGMTKVAAVILTGLLFAAMLGSVYIDAYRSVVVRLDGDRTVTVLRADSEGLIGLDLSDELLWVSRASVRTMAHRGALYPKD